MGRRLRRRRSPTAREAKTEEACVICRRGRGCTTIAVRVRRFEGALLRLALVDARTLRLRLRCRHRRRDGW